MSLIENRPTETHWPPIHLMNILCIVLKFEVNTKMLQVVTISEAWREKWNEMVLVYALC